MVDRLLNGAGLGEWIVRSSWQQRNHCTPDTVDLKWKCVLNRALLKTRTHSTPILDVICREIW